MTPDLTIVFINYNSTDLLDRALASLAGAEPALSVETIVVDNASRDRAALVAACGRHGARLLALGRNAGYGTAFNRGYRHARGRYVAVANPDLVFTGKAVTGLVRFMDEHHDAGAVAPQFLYGDGTPAPTARRFPRLRYVLSGRRSRVARIAPHLSAADEFLYAGIDTSLVPAEVESVVGAFVVFRRGAFEQAGGYDERYFMYVEDAEICRRIGRNWKVYLLPTVTITHLVGQTRRRYCSFSEFHRLRSHRRFFFEQAGSMGRAFVTLLFALYLAVQHAARAVGIVEYEYSWVKGGRR